MKSIYYLFILSIAFNSCTESPKKPAQTNTKTKVQQEKLKGLDLDFSELIQIDSSSNIMYPLILNKDNDDLYSIKSGSRATTYWNAAFYNATDQTYRLLDENRKMVIYEIDEKSGIAQYKLPSDKKRVSTIKSFIYYIIRSTDFNKNGNIDLDDPKYLFVSDQDGKNFKQISPDNMNVNSWSIIKGTDMIALAISNDMNNDKKFNEKDQVIPMVYKLKSDSLATEVFNEDFKFMIKKSLAQQWSPK